MAAITLITTEKRITGLIVGSVTQRMRWKGPAPSSSADSYSCCGASRIAARKMIIRFPTPQMLSSVSEGFDHWGDWNQSGPLMPRWPRMTFTGPVAGFRR